MIRYDYEKFSMALFLVQSLGASLKLGPGLKDLKTMWTDYFGPLVMSNGQVLGETCQNGRAMLWDEIVARAPAYMRYYCQKPNESFCNQVWQKFTDVTPGPTSHQITFVAFLREIDANTQPILPMPKRKPDATPTKK